MLINDLVQEQINKSTNTCAERSRNKQINRIILATHNAHKTEEVKSILQDTGIDVLSLKDIGWTDEIIEDGETFLDNASLKANAVAMKYQNDYILADDSGLVVDVLDGRPGVMSARYAGYDRSSLGLCSKLIKETNGFDFLKRTAYFVTVLAFYQPQKGITSFEGRVNGLITDRMIGVNGFGYDPVFYLPEKKKTMAELDAYEKNLVSHRYNALKKFKDYIND